MIYPSYGFRLQIGHASRRALPIYRGVYGVMYSDVSAEKTDMSPIPCAPTSSIRTWTVHLLFTLSIVLFGYGASPGAKAAEAEADDLIGTQGFVLAKSDDTLLDLARRFDIGYVEMRLANPGLDPLLAGEVLALIPGQHILPSMRHEGIVINLAELRLYFISDGSGVLSFPIGIGREGAETPIGGTHIVRSLTQPEWVPTSSERLEEADLPLRVAAGPDNPMGELALYLDWQGMAIHGTNQPDSIGRRGSHGCIRMYPEDVVQLGALVRPDTEVWVIDQSVKTGWHNGELWLEIHPRQSDVDAVESGDLPATPTDQDMVTEAVLEAAREDAGRVDWEIVEAAALVQSGMPVRVTRGPTTIEGAP